VFKAQAVHGISVYSEEHENVTKLVIWGGKLVRALEVTLIAHSSTPLTILLSDVAKAPDWVLDLASRPNHLEDEGVYHKGTCVAVTAHNALLQIDIERRNINRTADE
jgi:hypothetical protein